MQGSFLFCRIARVMRLRIDKGFTLIELMIVVSIIAVVAAMAIPNLLSAKTSANEGSAIAALRTIANTQVQCTNRLFIDADGDGRGEHGFFGELSGAVPARNNPGLAMVPPLLAGSFQLVNNPGVITRSGYYFMIYLPDVNGQGLGETPANYANVDADLAEDTWCAYAWPAQPNGAGQVFFVNQTGEIFRSDNTVQGYGGAAAIPAPDAAFDVPGAITGRVIPGQVANDGGVWTVK